jgi:hypothetical protein
MEASFKVASFIDFHFIIVFANLKAFKQALMVDSSEYLKDLDL